MSKPPARRGALAAAISAALLLGALAASQAQASTLYACVKKNGSSHLYGKKPKCKKGEKKLIWNTAGPAGKTGANGPNGAAGANGANGTNAAVTGFFAAEKGSQFLSSTLSTISGLEKALPAGTYLISANVGLEGFANSEGGAQEECELTTGASKTVGTWESPLLKVSAGAFAGEGSIPMTLAVTGPATVTVRCKQLFGIGTSIEVEAQQGTLAGVQVASIG